VVWRNELEVDMVHFADMTDEERFARLEHKAAETRKMLFGALLLAKEVWKEELFRRGEGLEIMEAMEKAEESFAGKSQPDRLKRIEQTLDVINRRAKSIFDLMSYISKYGGTD
jgi:hypothetical protein